MKRGGGGGLHMWMSSTQPSLSRAGSWGAGSLSQIYQTQTHKLTHWANAGFPLHQRYVRLDHGRKPEHLVETQKCPGVWWSQRAAGCEHSRRRRFKTAISKARKWAASRATSFKFVWKQHERRSRVLPRLLVWRRLITNLYLGIASRQLSITRSVWIFQMSAKKKDSDIERGT